ncbi:hypothetical protein D3C72_1530590 [compost metagenome]
MGVAARGKRQIRQLLLHPGHHTRVTVTELMDAVAMKVEVLLAGDAGQHSPLRPRQQIQTGGGERLMQKIAAILGQPFPYRLALRRPPALARLPQVDVPFGIGEAAAGQAGMAAHSAPSCQ